MQCMEIIAAYNRNSTKQEIHCIRKIRNLVGVLLLCTQARGTTVKYIAHALFRICNRNCTNPVTKLLLPLCVSYT